MPYSATYDSSLTGLRFVEETTPGVTPTNPVWKEIEVTSVSLDNSRQTEASQSFRADRQVPGVTIVAEDNGGEIGFELKYSDEIQDLLESALQDEWDGDSLSNGVKRKSYTFEMELGGGVSGGLKYRRMTGAEISSVSLQMAVGSFITGSFNVMGRDFAISNTIVANSTITPASQTAFMNAADTGVEIEVNGVAITNGILQNLEFTLDNNLRAQRAIGSPALAGMGAGRSNTTGKLTVFFNGGANPIYAAYIAKQPIKLAITIPDVDGNALEIVFWEVNLLNAAMPAGGLDQDIVLDIDFQAVLGGPDSKTITINRTDA